VRHIGDVAREGGASAVACGQPGGVPGEGSRVLVEFPRKKELEEVLRGEDPLSGCRDRRLFHEP